MYPSGHPPDTRPAPPGFEHCTSRDVSASLATTVPGGQAERNIGVDKNYCNPTQSLTFRQAIVLAGLLCCKIIPITFAAIVIEKINHLLNENIDIFTKCLARFGVRIEIVASDASAAAANADVTRLTAYIVLGWTA